MLGFTLGHPDPIILKDLGVWEWMNGDPMLGFTLEHPNPIILKGLGVWGCPGPSGHARPRSVPAWQGLFLVFGVIFGHQQLLPQ